MAEVSWLSEFKDPAAGSVPAAYGRDVLGMGDVFDAGVPGGREQPVPPAGRPALAESPGVEGAHERLGHAEPRGRSLWP